MWSDAMYMDGMSPKSAIKSPSHAVRSRVIGSSGATDSTYGMQQRARNYTPEKKARPLSFGGYRGAQWRNTKCCKRKDATSRAVAVWRATVSA